MRNSCFLLSIILLAMTACSTIKYVPVKEYVTVTETQTEYLRDTLVQVQIEKEYIRDYAGLLDTLRMETAYSKFVAFVDTSEVKLSGTARNKSENVINVPVQVKEKVIVRDSLVYKDVPVPVEVVKTVHPKYEWALWVWGIVSLLVLGFLLYRKIMPIFVGRRLL